MKNLKILVNKPSIKFKYVLLCILVIAALSIRLNLFLSSYNLVSISKETSTKLTKSDNTPNVAAIFRTGTHIYEHKYIRTTREDCILLENAVYDFISYFPSDQVEYNYTSAKSALENAIKGLDKTKTCYIERFNTNEGIMLLSFPLSLVKNSVCLLETEELLTTKVKLLKTKTKVLKPWFLLTPNLLTIAKLFIKHNIAVKFDINMEEDYLTSNFMNEGCKRFQTLLKNYSKYAETYFKTIKSSLKYQYKELLKLSFNNNGVVVVKTNDITLNEVKKLKKTIKQGTKFIFIAGLEGVGHHMFSDIGRKLSDESVYSKLTEYLTQKTINKTKTNQIKQDLVLSMKNIQNKEDKSIFFLNTVYTTHPVNMYSFPWGGPKCYLKKYARTVCNIDLKELVELLDNNGIDIRVIVLKRTFGASIASVALNRNYGTVQSVTKILAQSWNLLDNSLQQLDKSFFIELKYEHVHSKSKVFLKKLTKFLDISEDTSLYQQFDIAIQKASTRQQQTSIESWQTRMTNDELQFILDEYNSNFLNY